MQDAIGFREIDASRDARLMALTDTRHGALLLSAAAWTTRTFELSSPWAAGLRFVGAEAHCPSAPGIVPVATKFNLAGGGLTFEDAFASCLGECIERLSQIEHAGDIAASLGLHDADLVTPAAKELASRHLQRNGVSDRCALDWVLGTELGSGKPRLVPADWVLRRAEPGPLFDAATALSTGAAAAPTPAESAVRGLLELIERDAAAQWWIAGRRGRALRLEDFASSSIADTLRQLRQGCRRRLTWLIDITSDLGIPVAAAVSVAEDGRAFACGLAARTAISEAARAAVLELCQIELGLVLSLMRAAERGGEALSEDDRQILARSTGIDAAGCELIHGTGTPLPHAAVPVADGETTLATIADAFARQQVEAVLIDLTRPTFGVPVSRAFAPALQLMPSGLHTVRLETAHRQYGGGERWTQGIPLM
jgi:ribosomal protein S12 methylthiotransferase accessory factor